MTTEKGLAHFVTTLKAVKTQKELHHYLTTLKVFNTEKGHHCCLNVFNTEKGLRDFLMTLKVFYGACYCWLLLVTACYCRFPLLVWMISKCLSSLLVVNAKDRTITEVNCLTVRKVVAINFLLRLHLTQKALQLPF